MSACASICRPTVGRRMCDAPPEPCRDAVSGSGGEEEHHLVPSGAGYQQQAVPGASLAQEHRRTGRPFFKPTFTPARPSPRGPPQVLRATTARPVHLHVGLLDGTLFPCGAMTCRGADDVGCRCPVSIAYSNLTRNRKTIGRTHQSPPMLMVHYHVLLAGNAGEFLRHPPDRSTLGRILPGSQPEAKANELLYRRSEFGIPTPVRQTCTRSPRSRR